MINRLDKMDNSDISFQCPDADDAIEDNANEESVTVTVSYSH